jgi:hypothetical protein
MTSPTDGMALLAPDSAWRQWRNAVHLHNQVSKTERDDPFVPGSQANTDRVAAQVAQARAVWLQTMLAHFEQRRAAAHEGGHDVTSTAALKALRVPCKDCLTVTGEKDRSHKLDRDDTRLFPIIASCGAEEAINPLTEAMPTW